VGDAISVADTDETITRIEQASGSLIGPPFTSPAGGRMAVVADPDGTGFCLWQPGGHHGAQLVNEPGAWAMSSLHTPDLETSRRFYGAVFGWQPEPFGDATLFDTNPFGAARMVIAVLPEMRKRRSGVIIDFGSLAARCRSRSTLTCRPPRRRYSPGARAMDGSACSLWWRLPTLAYTPRPHVRRGE